MNPNDTWAIRVDLGGTKVEVARVDSAGRLRQRFRRPTNVKEGPRTVEKEIVDLARELQELVGSSPIGVGIGLAGQIDPREGVVIFAPDIQKRRPPALNDNCNLETSSSCCTTGQSSPESFYPSSLHASIYRISAVKMGSLPDSILYKNEKP